MALAATGIALGTIFFGPFLANEPYRKVYGSGDFNGFAAAYPVDELAEVKDALEGLPQSKTVVLPPTETAKLVVGSDGVAHKFIDKFYIYYLDQPSFYYGLTGDSTNKFEFFLLLGMHQRGDGFHASRKQRTDGGNEAFDENVYNAAYCVHPFDSLCFCGECCVCLHSRR